MSDQKNIDKSLRFFNKVWFNNNNDNFFFTIEDKEIDLPITINARYYSSSDNSNIIETRTYNETIKALQSKVDDNSIELKTSLNGSNTFNSNGTPMSVYSDASISKVIEWSTKYPAIQIKPIDIAMLQDFQSLPANRFMVLRRFNSSAPHNLFSQKKNKAISTMVGFYDLVDTPLQISYGEKWITMDDTFFSVLQDIIGIQFDSIPGMERLVTTSKQSPFAQDFMYKLGEKMGFIGINEPYGQANLIHESATRDVSGEELKTGLTTDFKFRFETTYVYQFIPGADSAKVFKDIIRNAKKMGTSNSVFLGGKNGIKTANEMFKAMAEGDISGFIGAIVEVVKDMTDTIIKAVSNTFMSISNSSNENNNNNGNNPPSSTDNVNFTILDGIKNTFGLLAQMRYNRYKWKIKGVLGNLSGAHTAPWHLTLGNPMKPWFSMGNLILESMEVEPSGELMFDDFPSTWKFTASLKNGRAMGGQEIFAAFNSGGVREYSSKDTLNKIYNLTLEEGTTIDIGNISIPYNKSESPERIEKNDTGNNPELIDPTSNILSDYAKTDE